MNAPAPPAALVATRPHAAIYVKLTLVALFWGGTFIAGRILAATMSANAAATGHFAIAALLLVVLTWKIEGGLEADRPCGVTTFSRRDRHLPVQRAFSRRSRGCRRAAPRCSSR